MKNTNNLILSAFFGFIGATIAISGALMECVGVLIKDAGTWIIAWSARFDEYFE